MAQPRIAGRTCNGPLRTTSAAKPAAGRKILSAVVTALTLASMAFVAPAAAPQASANPLPPPPAIQCGATTWELFDTIGQGTVKWPLYRAKQSPTDIAQGNPNRYLLQMNHEKGTAQTNSQTLRWHLGPTPPSGLPNETPTWKDILYDNRWVIDGCNGDMFETPCWLCQENTLWLDLAYADLTVAYMVGEGETVTSTHSTTTAWQIGISATAKKIGGEITGSGSFGQSYTDTKTTAISQASSITTTTSGFSATWSRSDGGNHPEALPGELGPLPAVGSAIHCHGGLFTVTAVVPNPGAQMTAWTLRNPTNGATKYGWTTMPFRVDTNWLSSAVELVSPDGDTIATSAASTTGVCDGITLIGYDLEDLSLAKLNFDLVRHVTSLTVPATAVQVTVHVNHDAGGIWKYVVEDDTGASETFDVVSGASGIEGTAFGDIDYVTERHPVTFV